MIIEEKCAEGNENRPLLYSKWQQKENYPEYLLALVRYNSFFVTSSSNIH